MKHKKTERPRVPAIRTVQMALRFTDEERRLVGEAAAPYPPSTWARIELVRVAREKLGKKGGG